MNSLSARNISLPSDPIMTSVSTTQTVEKKMPTLPIPTTDRNSQTTIRATQIKDPENIYEIATAPLGFSSSVSNHSQKRKTSQGETADLASGSSKKAKVGDALSDDKEDFSDNHYLPDVIPSTPVNSNLTSKEALQKTSMEQKKPHGEGKWTYDNGATFIGRIVDGSREGYSELRGSDGMLLFQGQYRQDKRNGPGKLHLNDGRIFEAAYIDDKMEGMVKITQGGKRIFKGPFINDQPHGKCMWFPPNGNICVAEFVNGYPRGKVDIYTFDGASVFHGQYRHDFLYGHEFWILPNRFVYDEEFRYGTPISLSTP